LKLNGRGGGKNCRVTMGVGVVGEGNENVDCRGSGDREEKTLLDSGKTKDDDAWGVCSSSVASCTSSSSNRSSSCSVAGSESVELSENEPGIGDLAGFRSFLFARYCSAIRLLCSRIRSVLSYSSCVSSSLARLLVVGGMMDRTDRNFKVRVLVPRGGLQNIRARSGQSLRPRLYCK
jgi:hypothetical protein